MNIRTVPLAALIGGSVFALHVATAQQSGVTRTDLQQHDLSIPGREVVQTRVALAKGITVSRHWHPGDEIVFMLEGTLEYQLEGRAPMTLTAGQVLFIPARTIHSAKNVGTGTGAELATYIVEKGKQLTVFVK
jgi:quercetin dioxygenase-like cupin family protein